MYIVCNAILYDYKKQFMPKVSIILNCFCSSSHITTTILLHKKKEWQNDLVLVQWKKDNLYQYKAKEKQEHLKDKIIEKPIKTFKLNSIRTKIAFFFSFFCLPYISLSHCHCHPDCMQSHRRFCLFLENYYFFLSLQKKFIPYWKCASTDTQRRK